MPTVAIIGAQWGDEGKGKITDYLAEQADAVVRFQGGNNAGHTIVIGDSVFKLHLLPSGVLRKGKLAVIGNGVVVNFADMEEEIKQIEEAGLSLDGLRISDRAHLIMNYHKKLDGAEEVYRGKKSVGTTKKGIGPTYQDKIARYGFRAGDLLEPDLIREKTKFMLPMKKDLMKLMGSEVCGCSEENFSNRLIGWGEKYGKYICDTSVLINDMLDEGKLVCVLHSWMCYQCRSPTVSSASRSVSDCVWRNRAEGLPAVRHSWLRAVGLLSIQGGTKRADIPTYSAPLHCDALQPGCRMASWNISASDLHCIVCLSMAPSFLMVWWSRNRLCCHTYR